MQLSPLKAWQNFSASILNRNSEKPVTSFIRFGAPKLNNGLHKIKKLVINISRPIVD